MNQTLAYFETCYEKLYPATENSDEAFAWFSDIPHPLFNAVMHLSCKDVRAKIDALIEKVPANNPISFWVHPVNQAEGLVEILNEKGFAPIITCPLMTWPVAPIKALEYDIRFVEENRDPFNRITGEAFHLDGIILQKYSNILETMDLEKYLLFINDEPVATGVLCPHGDIGGIFNIAVLQEHQKNGYGRAMMTFLMHRGNELGLKQLVLMSSPVAEKLYSDLGFEKIFDIEIYSR